MALDADFTKLTSLAQGTSGLLDLFTGASEVSRGAEIQAQSFRQMGAASLAAANYNIELDKIQTNRRLDATSRNVQRVLGQQRSQAIASGFASTSKSTMMLMHETMDAFERDILHTRTDAAQRQAGILFEGQARQIAAENKARISKFEARSRTQASKRKAIGSAISIGSTLLGDL